MEILRCIGIISTVKGCKRSISAIGMGSQTDLDSLELGLMHDVALVMINHVPWFRLRLSQCPFVDYQHSHDLILKIPSSLTHWHRTKKSRCGKDCARIAGRMPRILRDNVFLYGLG